MRRFLAAALLSLALPAASAAEPPWKVTEPHGPATPLRFTTDRGTWLALDVHPDGRRVVFSLLGDLYLLPLDGGEARRITSGPAYDVQPRFSPDGAWIAYASDRGGNENLWVCDLEGNRARQVSTEKATFVNSPAWTPDGHWLVGRKRLTDTSSLGTVELWMWHVKGGEGVRLTKKDEQPDAADPAFSPDGRFLYYAARDARYRYNRDVYEGIWQVKRLDRKTGQTVPLSALSGGAAAPLPSPDGRQLAYVRRADGRTVLERMDLDTGAIHRVAEGLTRDLQEGFAFHGTFPGYAWTRDGRQIVATAEGRIVRIDARSGDRTPVPFRAAVEQAVTEAVRSPQPVGGETIRARILRWPTETRDGRRLVFSALGHLWVADLAGGEPRRLTSSAELEYAPALSDDGARLAWVTWSDAEGGHVWTATFAGGTLGPPVRLTAVPGQYANPSFSPDGSRVVYLKGSGATFRDEGLSDELWHEIWWVETAGGPARFVRGTGNRGPNRRMPRPRWSADGSRIFWLEDDKDAKPFEVPESLFVSAQPDGTDHRVHLKFARAEEAVLSPDGKWVAFQELHDAYVTAFPETGDKPVTVSLEGSALPVARLSNEGGEWVGWADGGRTVTFIAGPVYRRAPLDTAFRPKKDTDGEASKESARKDDDGGAIGRDEDDGEETPARAPAQGKGRGKGKKEPTAAASRKDGDAPAPSAAHEIVLTVPRDRPAGTVAYTGARIVTMKGDEVLPRGTIVVDGDRIAAVGADVPVPAGARTVDLAGRTVIPGLFDAHAHLHYSTLDIFPQRPWKYLANLAYGVTTTHDPSASTQEVFGQAEMVEAGRMVGPRIFSTGYILYGADDASRAKIESLDEARRHVRRLKNLGAFTVKSYMQPRREQRQWLLQAAREEKMMVVPEGGGDLEADMTMVLDGHTTIEHSLPVAPLETDVLAMLGKSGTAYVPTLLVAYGGLAGDQWFLQHHDVWKDPRLTRFTPPGVLDPIARIRSVMAPDEEWHHLAVARDAAEVVKAGGTVLLGGHGQMQGLGPHWELWSFVRGGMTPLQALRAATLDPARALGLDRDLGSLEPGKLADFVVLAADPLERIENSEQVDLVVKNGRAYAPAELERRPRVRREAEGAGSASPPPPGSPGTR